MATIKKNEKVASVGRNVEKLETLCIGGNIKWYNCYEKQYEGSSKKKKKIELPHDLAIPLLGISPGTTPIQEDTRTPMLTAALFPTVKTWK